MRKRRPQSAPGDTLSELARDDPAAALARLGAVPAGLDEAVALARLADLGRNVLATRGRSVLRLFLAQLRSPLLGLLVAAASVSIALGERTDGAIILAIMVLSVALGFFNEFRSEQTLAALRDRTGRRATVLRGAAPSSISATLLVPGDICLLQAGDVVPADLRLIDADELAIDEAALTGEAFAAEKSTAPFEGVADVFPNCAYLGTVVRSGRASGVVALTGMRTRLGHVAAALDERQEPTSFQHGLTSFAGLLAKITGVLTVFIFVVNASLGRPVLDALLFSLAIAVGLTPQLLPAVVTVSLTAGARRMAKRSVLVKRLVSIEDLGDTDLLFTDKTGTLTEGQIRLRSALSPAGDDAPELVRLGLLSSDLDYTHGSVPFGNALDLAIWKSLEPAAARADLAAVDRIALLPFSFERRRTSVVLRGDEFNRLLCKGAAEEVVGRCSTVRSDGRTRPIEELRAEIDATLAAALDSGFRTVAVAERRVDPAAAYSANDEQGLELRGFLVFADPPKADAAASVARLLRLGIELKVLTGDHERTAAHVCREVGLPVAGVARGSDLAALSEIELEELVRRTTVFARVSPEQKAALVDVARRGGSSVAFLGDGVNDAIALRRADVGISVESAVDVAKEAADVLLLQKDLSVLADGVVEGRRIFANTMKYVLMGTSSNFGNMFSAAGASLFLSFLPMLPSQILLNNLLYDCSELAIPSDAVDEEMLARPEGWNIAFIRRFMLFFGPISSLYDFATFAVMLWVFHAHATLFRTGWFVESLGTQALVVFVIRTRRVPFFASRPSRSLLVTTLAVSVTAFVLPFSPVAGLLGFTGLPWLFLVIVAGMTGTYLLLAELAKSRFYQREDRLQAQENARTTIRAGGSALPAPGGHGPMDGEVGAGEEDRRSAVLPANR